MSPLATLRDALASVDEATLAAYLRVSIPTLRRYATGELSMNWVTFTRLGCLPKFETSNRELTSTAHERQRASLARRRERRATRRQDMPSQAAAAV